MSAVLKDNRITVEEYLEGELVSVIKHEYEDGYAYAMAGASKNHQSIADNVLGEIRQHLKTMSCRPFGADIKIKVAGKFYYPDMMVVCEDESDSAYYTESPILIVEVLSDSTKQRDKTVKKIAYQSLPSLQEYVLIEQDFVDVEVCRRSAQWQSQHYLSGDEVWFESIGFKLPIEEVYRWVENLGEKKALQDIETQRLLSENNNNN
jgi:Uma2 family endonuclease